MYAFFEQNQTAGHRISAIVLRADSKSSTNIVRNKNVVVRNAYREVIVATNGIEPEITHYMSIGGKYADITAEDLIRLGRDDSVKNPEEVIDCVLKGTENFETKI